jgi:hypothetical protein
MNEYRAQITRTDLLPEKLLPVAIKVPGGPDVWIDLRVADENAAALTAAQVGEWVAFTITGSVATVIHQSEDGSTWSLEAPAVNVRSAG